MHAVPNLLLEASTFLVSFQGLTSKLLQMTGFYVLAEGTT